MNGNNYVSLAEFDRGVRDVLNLPNIFTLKKVINQAFKAAKTNQKASSFRERACFFCEASQDGKPQTVEKP